MHTCKNIKTLIPVKAGDYLSTIKNSQELNLVEQLESRLVISIIRNLAKPSPFKAVKILHLSSSKLLQGGFCKATVTCMLH
jgi:hypothetical protein